MLQERSLLLGLSSFWRKDNDRRGTQTQHPAFYYQDCASFNQLESAQNPNPTFRTDPATTRGSPRGAPLAPTVALSLRLGALKRDCCEDW